MSQREPTTEALAEAEGALGIEVRCHRARARHEIALRLDAFATRAVTHERFRLMEELSRRADLNEPGIRELLAWLEARIEAT